MLPSSGGEGGPPLEFGGAQLLHTRQIVPLIDSHVNFTAHVRHRGHLHSLVGARCARCASHTGQASTSTPAHGAQVGGYEAYLLADEKDGVEAAEAYRAVDDDESGVLNVSAASNSLNLVLRDEGLMRFVKYLSAQAPSSRWDVSMTYQPEEDEEEERAADEAAKGDGSGLISLA